MQEIRPLTSLRGIFAMWVVSYHLRTWSSFAHSPVPIIDRGYLGVDFFFLLSGFILAGSNGELFAIRYDAGAHLRFVGKRIGRIFPLHLLVILIMCISIEVLGQPRYWWRNILIEAALVHRWWIFYAPRSALNAPDWSISTEWAANLAFPLFISASGIYGNSRWRQVVAVVGSISTLLVIFFRRGSLDVAEANSLLPIARCFAEFLLGIVLFGNRRRFTPLASDFALLAMVLFMTAGLLLRLDLATVGMMILILPSAEANRGYVGRALSISPLHWLGSISYSIYLIQLPVIMAMDALISGWQIAPIAHWVLTPIAVVALSWITYHLVEKPGKQAVAWSAQQLSTVFKRASMPSL